MDGSSWIHGYSPANSSSTGNSGFMCGYAASCVTPGLQFTEKEEEELLVSSQIQHHLNQISMYMNMDDVEPVYDAPSGDGAAVGLQRSVVDVGLLPSHHAGCFLSSSSSSSFRSASLSCSPESSAHVLTAPNAGAGCLQYPEVSSHVPLVVAPVVLPYDDDGQYLNFHDAAAMAPEMSTSAFRRYARHLGPRRKPKPRAACGQRMFKTAMSVLAKMHMSMRSSHAHQYYYQQASAAAAELPPPSGNQLQHVISERKRREKLNDSFHALKTVLPRGSKKDKTSILITAREYVNSLRSKVSELEEKNQVLESRLERRAGAGVSEDDNENGEKVEIQITRAATAEEEPREICTVKIAVRSACGNTTDVVLRTLQCLKDQMGDGVTLVAMSTSDGAGDGGAVLPRASLTLQLKSASGAKWEEAAVKEVVAKAVADALRPQSAEMTVARRGDTSRPQH